MARRRRNLRKLLIGVLATFGLGAVWWFWSGERLDSQIEHQHQLLRELGAATTVDEYLALTKREGPDVTKELKRAHDAYKAIDQDLSHRWTQTPADSPQRAKVDEEFMAFFQPILPDVEKIAKGRAVHFTPESFDTHHYDGRYTPLDAPPSEEQMLMTIESATKRYAIACARLGRSAEALRASQLVRKIIEVEETYPEQNSLTSRLDEIKSHRRFVVSLAVLLKTPDDLRSLLAQIDRPLQLPEAKYFYLGEPLANESEIMHENPDDYRLSHVFQGHWPETPSDYVKATLRGRKLVSRRVLQAWIQALTEMSTNPRDYELANEAHERALRSLETDEGLIGQLALAEFPDSSWLRDERLEAEAINGAARTCIRLLLHRLENGSFPATLPPYGEASRDPFSREPLRYLVNPTEVVVYSVGTDRIDEKGANWEAESAVMRLPVLFVSR